MKTVCLLTIAALCCARAEILTDNKGRKIDAEVGAITTEKVALKLQDKSYEIEIKSLSAASQQRIREIEKQRAQEKPVADGGELLAKALAQFSAAKSERELCKIREDRLVELFESKIPIRERRGVNQGIEGMYEQAYLKLNVPPGVTVKKAELVEGVYKKTGIPYQELRCELENTGKLPISQVWATIQPYDGEGNPMRQKTKVLLYVEEVSVDGNPVFKPGMTMKDKEEDGEQIASRNEPRAATAKVIITRVVH